jgi:hypothetical protein
MKMKTYRIAALGGYLLLALGALTAAEQREQDNGEKKSPAAKTKPRPTPPELALPAGAVQTDANTYTYTDEQGKKWTYRRTPFGLARLEARETSAADRENLKKDSALIQAFADGDFVRFERPGPFGVYRWKQKKTELSPVEQAAWDRARAPNSGAGEKE